MRRFFLIISGPTGVGKTAFVLQLAQKLAMPVCLINGDMGQMYQPLSIGTAKPTGEEQAKFEHLGFDIVDKPRDFTVTEYRELLVSLLEKCWEENKLPIIVGGSGFYLKSILFPPVGKGDAESPARLILRASLRQGSGGQASSGPLVRRSSLQGAKSDQDERDGEVYHSEDDESSQLSPWEYLEHIDPVRAREIHPHDTYRISRAIALWRKTGILPSKQKPVFDPPGDFYFLFFTRDKQDLWDRINKRTEQMIAQGWIDEVKNLSPEWREFLIQKKIIGYPEIIAFCEKESKMQTNLGNKKSNPEGTVDKSQQERLIADIQAKTRAYAKKQATFWRALKAQIEQAGSEKKNRIEELNLTLALPDIYEIEKYIINQTK